MKQDIHPHMFADATAECTSCNAKFAIPSTAEELKIEVCSQCHPVYTGKQQKEMKGGRVERFRKRLAASKKDA